MTTTTYTNIVQSLARRSDILAMDLLQTLPVAAERGHALSVARARNYAELLAIELEQLKATAETQPA